MLMKGSPMDIVITMGYWCISCMCCLDEAALPSGNSRDFDEQTQFNTGADLSIMRWSVDGRLAQISANVLDVYNRNTSNEVQDCRSRCAGNRGLPTKPELQPNWTLEHPLPKARRSRFHAYCSMTNGPRRPA